MSLNKIEIDHNFLLVTAQDFDHPAEVDIRPKSPEKKYETLHCSLLL